MIIKRIEYEEIADLLTGMGLHAPDGKPWTTERLYLGAHRTVTNPEPITKSDRFKKAMYEDAKSLMWKMLEQGTKPVWVALALNTRHYRTFTGKLFTASNVRGLYKTLKKQLIVNSREAHL